LPFEARDGALLTARDVRGFVGLAFNKLLTLPPSLADDGDAADVAEAARDVNDDAGVSFSETL
jgi:hypothetical protein